MGGSFFTSLHTPRMPAGVYEHVKADVHRKLSTAYAHVSTPIEAPAKADHGDVDVLVYGELNPNSGNVETGERLKALLGAETFKQDAGGGEEWHFALPWPDAFSRPSAASSAAPDETPTAETDSACQTDRFVQLDLHVCPALDVYAWHVFRCAHGDFWSIVGSVIRGYGLSFRNTGLYVRIPELETGNRKMSFVRLSDEPESVLRFLFRDEKEVGERFWKADAFGSVDGMCEFIRETCAFYRPLREKEKGEVEEGEGLTVEVAAQVGGRKQDKARFVKRANYRYWFEEYVPKHSPGDRESGWKGRYAGMTREEVADMVKMRFGVKGEYEENQRQGLRQMNVEALWGGIRSSIQSLEFGSVMEGRDGVSESGIEVKSVMRTLRRKVSVDVREEKDGKLSEVQLAYREGRFDEVKKWAEENWKEITEKQNEENETKAKTLYEERLNKIQAAGGFMQTNVLESGALTNNTFSKSPSEVWTAEDDKLLRELKTEGRSWKQIVAALGDKHHSITQAKARWKDIEETLVALSGGEYLQHGRARPPRHSTI